MGAPSPGRWPGTLKGRRTKEENQLIEQLVGRRSKTMLNGPWAGKGPAAAH